MVNIIETPLLKKRISVRVCASVGFMLLGGHSALSPGAAPAMTAAGSLHQVGRQHGTEENYFRTGGFGIVKDSAQGHLLVALREHKRPAEAVRREQKKPQETRTRMAPDAAAKTPYGLRRKVKALPVRPIEVARKRAALLWALDDAEASSAAGMDAASRSLLDDVRAALDKPPAAAQDPGTEVLPPVTEPKENPYLQSVLKKVRPLRDRKQRFPKGAAGYTSIKNAWRFTQWGPQTYMMAWAACHPASLLRGDPALIAQVLVFLQGVFQNHRDGDLNAGRTGVKGSLGPDENINRFCFVPAFEAYLLLRETWPDLIPPSKRLEWEASIRAVTEFQLKTYGEKVFRHGPGWYPNMDVHYLLLMELASRILGNHTWHQEAERFLTLTANSLYPDGAFTYLGRQNECFVYHEVIVANLARYWQLTGSSAARDLVLDSAPYYPGNVEPGGVPEYYTDPFWKHYWAGASPIGPDIVSSMLHACRPAEAHLAAQNRRVANVERKWPMSNSYYAIYAATLWRSLPDAPQRDGYVMYDRNVQGPRGRYGRWSFAGTTRDYGTGAQGKDTFVGAMLTAKEKKQFPLDAALQSVTSMFRLQHGGQEHKDWRYLSADEQSAVTVTKNLAALTTGYRIQNLAWGGRSTLTNWEGRQEWLMTPNRIVGTLSIGPLGDEKAYAIQGRIRLGMKRAIKKKDNATFQYGGLLVRLHEHNYADIVTKPPVHDRRQAAGQPHSAEIILRDEQSVRSGEKNQATYAAGTEQFFTVEVFPLDMRPALRVKRHDLPGGLRALEMIADGEWLLLIHNPGNAPVPASVEAPDRVNSFLYDAQGRPSMPMIEKPREGRISCSVPPRSHILLAAPALEKQAEAAVFLK
jgi:hypothetical protein